jgi:hypothetical protein
MKSQPKSRAQATAPVDNSAAIEANLRRALAANEFAQNCLQPARSPYQAQSLPAAEAMHELQRCLTIKARIAQLRARAGQRRAA